MDWLALNRIKNGEILLATSLLIATSCDGGTPDKQGAATDGPDTGNEAATGEAGVGSSDDPLYDIKVVFAEAWCSCYWDNGNFTSEADCVERYPGSETNACEADALVGDSAATPRLQCLMDAAVAEAECVRAGMCGPADDVLGPCDDEERAAIEQCPEYPADVVAAVLDCQEPEPYWMVGDGGVIFGIDEDGRAAAEARATSADLRAIVCDGAARAWVVGDGGTVLSTTDGGGSWTHGHTGIDANLRAVAQVHAREVLAAGDAGAVVLSHDGGRTWEQLSAPALDFTGASAAPGDAWLLSASDGTLWRHDPIQGFMKTVDAGVPMFAVAASHHGLLAAAAGAHGTLLVSIDGGERWTPRDLALDEDLLAVSAFDPDVVIATGSGGAVVRWDAQGAVVQWPASNGAAIAGVHVTGDGVGAAVGQRGTFLQTSDGARSWTRTDLGLGADLRAVDQPFHPH